MTSLLDPYDYDFHEDPYPYYKRLRDEAPLYHNEELGFWALSRHQDVLQGFRNSTTLSNRDGRLARPDLARGRMRSKTMSFLAMDDPAHLRLRTLVSKGFTPRRIRELEPRVTELAVQHLDAMLERAGRRTVDYVAEFAGKLPMDVISELMGVPSEDRDGSGPWPTVSCIARTASTTYPSGDRGIDQPDGLLPGDDRRAPQEADRRSDSALLEAEIDGDRLTDEEVLGFMFLMVIAGNETTTKLLANAAFWGHKNPDQLAPVYADLERIPLWVEETLRYDTSSQILARVVSGELTLYDTTFPTATCCCCCRARRTATSGCSRTPTTIIIGREIGSKLRVSAAAPTSASARTWPGWRPGWR